MHGEIEFKIRAQVQTMLPINIDLLMTGHSRRIGILRER